MDRDAAVPWQERVFGDHREAVGLGLGQALRNMHENARNAQEEAQVEDADPYGSSRYTNQFARVEDELKGIPGARPVRPRGFRFNLMLVERGLIYPFRYAKKKADVRLAHIPHSLLIRELLANFGTEPESQQGAFLFEEGGFDSSPTALRAGLADLPADTKLVLVPFACNVGSLLESYWGVASLGADGSTVEWASRPDPLPVPEQATVRPRLTAVPQQGVPLVTEMRSFDEGAEPMVLLSSRPGGDVKRDITPTTEFEQIEPQANQDEDH